MQSIEFRCGISNKYCIIYKRRLLNHPINESKDVEDETVFKHPS